MKRIVLLPEGNFELIPMAKRGIQNCKLCWFGQTDNGQHHCPEGYRCSFDDGTAIIFRKVGEIKMNDKKKPEPKEMDGIVKRITAVIESIIKRQDILSERITTIEQNMNERK